MTFCIVTLGCKVNQYESQVMHETLVGAGFTPAPFTEKPEICILNSCTVTSVSDNKAYKWLRRIRRENPNAIIVLTGCLPQAFPQEHTRFLQADIVLGNKCRGDLLRCIAQFLETREKVYRVVPHDNGAQFEAMTIHAFDGRTRAFVKIEDGCNRFCSYCIIPYARGRVRSKALEDIKQEITYLAQKGYKEVVLVGINLSAYGQDLGLNLADAIETACSVNGICRVRLGSLEPERMDEATIARLSGQKKHCPQFHISLQSGCDATLRRMNRHYNAQAYFTIVQNLRRAFANSAITTDVMVGFPGETQEEFEQSCAFVKKVGFAKVHVFSYSRRPGTVADQAPGQVEASVREQRAKTMLQLAQQARQAFLSTQTGRCEEVLFETRSRDGACQGYTKNYTPVQVRYANDLSGRLQMVKLTAYSRESCQGVLLEPLK